MNAVIKPAQGKGDFHVADLSLAEWGRKEIRIAETEMPGLMAIREEFARNSNDQSRSPRSSSSEGQCPGSGS